jgi:hypothetical protein
MQICKEPLRIIEWQGSSAVRICVPAGGAQPVLDRRPDIGRAQVQIAQLARNIQTSSGRTISLQAYDQQTPTMSAQMPVGPQFRGPHHRNLTTRSEHLTGAAAPRGHGSGLESAVVPVPQTSGNKQFF